MQVPLVPIVLVCTDLIDCDRLLMEKAIDRLSRQEAVR
jgi:hypothetical protein